MTRLKAFTLIELLIVVAIIGILAAIAVPNFLNAQIRAKLASEQSQMKSIADSLEMYFLDRNAYPNDHDLDAYNAGREHGLFKLTSPIAYMSEVPRQQFVNENLASLLSLGNSNAYASNGRPDYEMGSGSDNEGRLRVHAWSLMGLGPDGDDDIGSHDPFPFGVHIKPYDTSNGLHSSGDTTRIGGDYNRGCFQIGLAPGTIQQIGGGCR